MFKVILLLSGLVAIGSAQQQYPNYYQDYSNYYQQNSPYYPAGGNYYGQDKGFWSKLAREIAANVIGQVIPGVIGGSDRGNFNFNQVLPYNQPGAYDRGFWDQLAVKIVGELVPIIAGQFDRSNFGAVPFGQEGFGQENFDRGFWTKLVRQVIAEVVGQGAGGILGGLTGGDRSNFDQFYNNYPGANLNNDFDRGFWTKLVRQIVAEVIGQGAGGILGGLTGGDRSNFNQFYNYPGAPYNNDYDRGIFSQVFRGMLSGGAAHVLGGLLNGSDRSVFPSVLPSFPFPSYYPNYYPQVSTLPAQVY